MSLGYNFNCQLIIAPMLGGVIVLLLIQAQSIDPNVYGVDIQLDNDDDDHYLHGRRL